MIPMCSFCNVAVMPVRSEPTHRAEQTTQLLYGEKALILEVNSKDWAKIRCNWDGYEGWCKLSQLMIVGPKDFNKVTKFVSATHIGRIIFESTEMQLPLGSELLKFKGGIMKGGHQLGIFKGKKINSFKYTFDAEHIKKVAMQYMHAPYVWGGRSLAGIDCSGLTQMVFKLCNQKLPRDARQQAEKGELVDFLQNARCGDLAFFDDGDGRIVHVGILLDNQTIIHATDTSGRVVIDRIDQGGIISVSLRKRTHNLRFVKRFLGGEGEEKKAAAGAGQLFQAK